MNKWILYCILFLLCIPQLTYRFLHRDKTETELFLDFFKAYKEFIWGVDDE